MPNKDPDGPAAKRQSTSLPSGSPDGAERTAEPSWTESHREHPAFGGPDGQLPSVRSGEIPPATASRLGLYLRELQHFMRGGTTTIKSNALGRRLGLSDSQIRRDLALFGEFGKRGVGYNVQGLVTALRKALGTDGTWNTVLIGLGNLGTALVRYRGFQQQGFKLQAIFETDATKIGTHVEGIPIYNIDDLEKIIPTLNPRMAILAVPFEPAPAIARRLVDLGIAGILNFAPVSLAVHNQVSTVDVDLAVELQRLAFAVVNSNRSSNE
jgi:redox-sensing transcriptional repressor